MKAPRTPGAPRDSPTAHNAVVLFDGVCNMCNASVNFIIDRDPNAYFRFASLQSELGASLRESHGLPASFDSFVLIERGRVHLRSGAALRVARRLTGMWSLLYGLIVVPSFIRDLCYRLVANNRYRWFGRLESCRLPTPELRDRFLDG